MPFGRQARRVTFIDDRRRFVENAPHSSTAVADRANGLLRPGPRPRKTPGMSQASAPVRMSTLDRDRPGVRYAVMLARIATAGFFITHAVTRIANGTIPRFGAFLEGRGFADGVAVVWAITAIELVAGALLIVGRLVAPASVALFCIALGGIILIHARNGWFVGEHGAGGAEYSVALMVLLTLIATEAVTRHKRYRGLAHDPAILPRPQ